MQIYINGEEKTVAAESSMAALIEQLALTDKRVAVEVNEELVPRSTFEQHLIQANDRIEIINAVGGG
ncbi:MAG: sulfur carrier protein ThiS [Candidatus Polarisedimenticolaceae bacterium]|nr:sulfur carrier protein ThiS [Candidatus Polarisedimenticolaceae bacterium]